MSLVEFVGSVFFVDFGLAQNPLLPTTHMASNKRTVSRQASMSGQHLRKLASFLTSGGNSALLLASARDQTVTKVGMIIMRLMSTPSARRVFQILFCFVFTIKRAI